MLAIPSLQGSVSPAAAEQVAHFSSEYEIPRSADWVGGLSGFALAANGVDFYVISDRGSLAQGSIKRENDDIVGISFDTVQPILNRFGVPHDTQFADAEGLAIAEDGRIFISFETEDRVSVYDGFGSPERLAGFTTEWRVFPKNKGLEALALAPDGSLWALPEYVWNGGTEARLYHRVEDGEWQLRATLPTEGRFKPVGADFGPDGRLYILERAFFAFGFTTRVRRLTLDKTEIGVIETVLQTEPRRHGNLEGITVWQDPMGQVRLTMVADDNFRDLQSNQMVEYVLREGLAQPDQ